MNLATLNPRVWLELAAVAILATAGWYGYNWIYDRGAASVQARWDAETKDEAIQSAKVAVAALTTTQTLITDFASQRSTTNAQISSLNNTVAAAVAGLRNRPARDSAGGVPSNPATGSALGATGADLLRQDSEFLVGEGARADKLRLQLIECQGKYNTVYDALNPKH